LLVDKPWTRRTRRIVIAMRHAKGKEIVVRLRAAEAIRPSEDSRYLNDSALVERDHTRTIFVFDSFRWDIEDRWIRVESNMSELEVAQLTPTRRCVVRQR